MLIRTLFIAVTMLTAMFSTATAQTAATTTADSSAMLVGKWTGSYEGADSGNFELNLSRDSQQKLTGQIVMLAPDGSRYPIDLKTVTWQNGRLSAAYSNPQNGGDVSFTGTFDAAALKGTWQANGGQDTGNWQVSRANR